ncbi:uncharacterized protein LOC113234476 [Hyposmocoma kahamanoa]|uniref:uncharacterized protein LOC113234476 n=1 Tax=Hyposmocoma kahamanoa TaxID=1477025 RepID=UPI000E6D69DF|nr:uncharacterized protein LOC113234476 [Hyposmocoma kahamanoa]
MSGFKALKDVCHNFEEELRKVSNYLIATKIGDTFEDGVAKKIRDLTLFTSKLRLLRADPISRTPQIAATEHDVQTTRSNYGDLAAWRVIEQQTVKAVTQSHAVRTLISTPDSVLDPEMIERKEKILYHLSEYNTVEAALQQVDNVLKVKEQELFALRQKWDLLLGELRDMRENASGKEIEDSGPVYVKLKHLVNKLELIRWLICKLAIPRSRGYDWIVDPHRRLQALKLARDPINVDTFIQST